MAKIAGFVFSCTEYLVRRIILSSVLKYLYVCDRLVIFNEASLNDPGLHVASCQ